MDSGIISKERVKQYGEVFTPDSIVCDMIDLVEKRWGDISDEEYILKTYLEPACGDGQFLIRLLSRKLERVAKLPVEERELALNKGRIAKAKDDYDQAYFYYEEAKDTDEKD